MRMGVFVSNLYEFSACRQHNHLYFFIYIFYKQYVSSILLCLLQPDIFYMKIGKKGKSQMAW